MRMRRLVSTCLAVTLATAVSGCSHAVVMDTEPSGGEIRVNGNKLGTGPVTYTETTGWEKVYQIEASKPGFGKTKTTLKQTEFNTPVVAASVGGALCLGVSGVGLLALLGIAFSKQLPDQVTIKLEEGGEPVDEGTPSDAYGY